MMRGGDPCWLTQTTKTCSHNTHPQTCTHCLSCGNLDVSPVVMLNVKLHEPSTIITCTPQPSWLFIMLISMLQDMLDENCCQQTLLAAQPVHFCTGCLVTTLQPPCTPPSLPHYTTIIHYMLYSAAKCSIVLHSTHGTCGLCRTVLHVYSVD